MMSTQTPSDWLGLGYGNGGNGSVTDGNWLRGQGDAPGNVT